MEIKEVKLKKKRFESTIPLGEQLLESCFNDNIKCFELNANATKHMEESV